MEVHASTRGWLGRGLVRWVGWGSTPLVREAHEGSGEGDEFVDVR